MEKEKVYLDSTIPSYATGKPSRDLIVAARQEVTTEWWENERKHFELYGSFVLMEEIEDGYRELAEKRLELVKEITILDNKPEIEEMARKYMSHFKFPEKLFRDMYHVAFAVYYEMDYLLTWNFTHLANVDIEKQLERFNQKLGHEMPRISTPEEVRKLKIGGKIW
jgi:predicted nucleic acid-binding protein